MATKKKYVKELRRIASELPPVERRIVVRQYVKGASLIESGKTTAKDGAPIDPTKNYKTYGEREAMTINHARNMKKMLKRYAAAGVKSYVNAVHKHADALKAQQVNQNPII